MNQKVRAVLPIIAVVLLLSACSSNSMASTYKDDKKIASETNTFNMGDIEQEVSENRIEAKIDMIEGMETIWSFTAEDDMGIELSGEMAVQSGKAKLVLILPDSTLTVLAEKDSATESNEITQTLSVKKGLNRIKIVAEKNTKVDLEISSTGGEFKKMGIEW